MTTKEIIEPLTILKNNAVKSCNDTAVLEIKQDKIVKETDNYDN